MPSCQTVNRSALVPLQSAADKCHVENNTLFTDRTGVCVQYALPVDLSRNGTPSMSGQSLMALHLWTRQAGYTICMIIYFLLGILSPNQFVLAAFILFYFIYFC